jgi:hypothetical protein
MATGPDTGAREGGIVRKLLVPTAISAAGGAVGLMLTKKQELRQATSSLRETVSDLPLPDVREGVGDLTDDLRGKLDSVLGKDEPNDDVQRSGRRVARDRGELERRVRERRERREQRRRRARSG